ncbi:MAG: gliding motility-associated ABC transporter substrate-binding protein GldG [Dysgonomonas sp.]
MNSGFQKLHNAVDDLLSDFERYSKNTINHKFVDPRHLADNSADLSNYMASMQMNGITLNEVGRDGKTSQSTIYPYAQIIRGEDTLSVKLLKNVAGYSSEENLNASVENLEFEFIDALRLLKNGDPVDIAFIEGHEEIERPYVYDAERLLSKYYFVNRGEIGNDVSVLKPFKVIIIAGPQKRFSETEKFVLDQYVMNGGRVLWLIDGVYLSHSDLEKLGQSPSMKNDVGLDDMLFTYGVRINPVLLQDKQCLPIYLTSGESDANNQYVQVPWYYSPLLLPSIDNPLTKDISLVKSVFASSIDFVGKNSDIKKDVLLTTSSNSHIVEVPEMIHFDTERALTTSNYFNQSFLPVGVTLEGKFNSLFENRLTPADIQMNGKQIKTASEHTKMIVVSSSSIIKNDLINYDGQTQALPMGFDRVTERQFGNPDFIVNAVNWLANDDDWFSLRNKHQKIRLLDRQKIYENGNQYSIIAVCVPVFFSLLVIGLCYYIRKRKYEKTI